jgi:hypothetical protein
LVSRGVPLLSGVGAVDVDVSWHPAYSTVDSPRIRTGLIGMVPALEEWSRPSWHTLMSRKAPNGSTAGLAESLIRQGAD